MTSRTDRHMSIDQALSQSLPSHLPTRGGVPLVESLPCQVRKAPTSWDRKVDGPALGTTWAWGGQISQTQERARVVFCFSSNSQEGRKVKSSSMTFFFLFWVVIRLIPVLGCTQLLPSFWPVATWAAAKMCVEYTNHLPSSWHCA